MKSLILGTILILIIRDEAFSEYKISENITSEASTTSEVFDLLSISSGIPQVSTEAQRTIKYFILHTEGDLFLLKFKVSLDSAEWKKIAQGNGTLFGSMFTAVNSESHFRELFSSFGQLIIDEESTDIRAIWLPRFKEFNNYLFIKLVPESKACSFARLYLVDRSDKDNIEFFFFYRSQ